MELDKRLKELRMRRGITQEQAAQVLGVSAQVVSKWERGLTQPDVQMMPKIAVLYRISLDELYDMDVYYTKKHHEEYRERLRAANETGDPSQIFWLIAEEIELRPDAYWEYLNLADHAAKHRLNTKPYIDKLVLFTERAEHFCREERLRHAIFRCMVRVCSSSEETEIRRLARDYYEKLPYFRNIRETVAQLVLEGEELEREENRNILYIVQSAADLIRARMYRQAGTAEEKLRYYHMSSGLLEAVTEEKFTGFFEIPLLNDYYHMAKLYAILGDAENSGMYLRKIINALRRHLSAEAREDLSEFADDPTPRGYIPYWESGLELLEKLNAAEEFTACHTELCSLYEEYRIFYEKEDRI